MIKFTHNNQFEGEPLTEKPTGLRVEDEGLDIYLEKCEGTMEFLLTSGNFGADEGKYSGLIANDSTAQKFVMNVLSGNYFKHLNSKHWYFHYFEMTQQQCCDNQFMQKDGWFHLDLKNNEFLWEWHDTEFNVLLLKKTSETTCTFHLLPNSPCSD